MADFTKGPWRATKRYSKESQRFLCVSIESEKGRQIAIMTEHHGDEPLTPMSSFETSKRDRKDAKLILLAPDMMELIEVFGDHNLKWDQNVINNFRKAANLLANSLKGTT